MASRSKEVGSSRDKAAAYFEVSQADFAANSKAWFAKAKQKPVRVYAANGKFMSIYRPQKPL